MLEKSVVLIDAENILKNWQIYCKRFGVQANIDYVKLVAILSKDTNLLRAYFYDGVPANTSAKKKSFLVALQKRGIQLRTKVLKTRVQVCEYCHKNTVKEIQKGVDVSLATDILRHAWQGTCDICIVVSGDEDYKDAIEVAKDKGVKVWVAAFSNSLSSEMEKIADKTIRLENFFEEIMLKTKDI